MNVRQGDDKERKKERERERERVKRAATEKL
jgi:hypothetical protein